MNYAPYIKEIGRGAEGARDLVFDDAKKLYGAMLDGEVPDLELGAILIALRMKGESTTEMCGFLEAACERTSVLKKPHNASRPLVIPSYNGARKGANLTPLLALLLQRSGVSVVVHGLQNGFGRVTSEQIFLELGVRPSENLSQAQHALHEYNLAFVPLPLIAPGLARLLNFWARLGLRNAAHSLVKMLDPFGGEGVLLGAATHPAYMNIMREIFSSRGQRALLLRATEGEPFDNTKRCPRIEYVHEAAVDILFEAEHDSVKALPNLPDDVDAVATAAWISKVLEGQLPLPQPIAKQFAACLYASGYVQDLNQAKAIIGVDSGVHLTVANN